VDLPALVDGDALVAERCRKSCGQLLRSHVAIEARVESAGDAVAIEGRLQLRRGAAVELVDETRVSEPTEQVREASIRREPVLRERCDDKTRLVHLAFDALVVIPVV